MNKLRKKTVARKLTLVVFSLIVLFQSTSVLNANTDQLSLNNSTYHVKKINGEGLLESVAVYDNYNEALIKLNESLKTSIDYVITTTVTHNGATYDKIINQYKGGFAQSFPYRKGTVRSFGGDVTLRIYNNKELKGSHHTYIPAHYQMQVIEIVPVGNSFSALIEIAGSKGFVDINKIDLIPLSFYPGGIAAGKEINLGGFVDYPDTNNNQTPVVVNPDVYNVTSSGDFNEISMEYNRTHPNLKTSIISSYAVAPTWLPVGKYYSNDGIHFFTDIARTKPVMNGKSQGKFHAYYQWLQVNSETNYSGADFKDFLDSVRISNSAYYNLTEDFSINGKLHGMNASLIFAQANLESGYGTSTFSYPPYNNIFGWKAVDSNPENASKYPSVSASIKQHMSHNFALYMNPNDKTRHNGYSYGNKGSGVSMMYASDPFYGLKIASIAYRIDKNNGFKEYNKYEFSYIHDGSVVDFFSNDQGMDSQYRSLGGENQIINNLGESNGYIRTNRIISNKEDKSINLNEDFVYINSKNTYKVPQYGPNAKEHTDGGNIEIKPIDDTLFISTGILNVREKASTSSVILGTYPKNTRLHVVELVGKDWAKVKVDGMVGYAHRDSLNQMGDLNNSGRSGEKKIFDIGDVMQIENHMKKITLLTEDKIKIADLNDNGRIDIGDLMQIVNKMYEQ